MGISALGQALAKTEAQLAESESRVAQLEQSLQRSRGNARAHEQRADVSQVRMCLDPAQTGCLAGAAAQNP
jgi:hypothetical protein